MTATLHGYWRSSAAYRVRIALNLKCVSVEHRAVDLRSGEQRSEEFRKLHHAGLVPSFVTEDGVALNQSMAIIEYLDEMFPDPPLLPAEPLARARVRAAAQAIACDIHPIANLRVLQYLKANAGFEQAQLDDWARHWIDTGLVALEQDVAGNTGAYLFGDAPTLADVCLVPQIYNARRFACDISRYPRLVAADEALNALPAFAAALPERQSDAS